MGLYTRKQLIEKLLAIEDDAYGWHINGQVLGIDVSDFEDIMHQAACMLGAEKIVTGEEDPIGINVPKNIVRNMPTIRR